MIYIHCCIVLEEMSQWILEHLEKDFSLIILVYLAESIDRLHFWLVY